MRLRSKFVRLTKPASTPAAASMSRARPANGSGIFLTSHSWSPVSGCIVSYHRYRSGAAVIGGEAAFLSAPANRPSTIALNIKLSLFHALPVMLASTGPTVEESCVPASVPMKTKDGRFSYEAAGDPHQPLVFLHEIGGAARAGAASSAAFGDRYRAIAWDMPGYGGSVPLPTVSISALPAHCRLSCSRSAQRGRFCSGIRSAA